MPSAYSRSQIVLHWIVALLVLAQFLNDGPIKAAWRAIRRGQAEVPGGFLVTAHVLVGIAILALVVWRFVLRRTRGVPPPPPDEPRLLKLAAAGTHGLLYLLLLLLPLSGLASWYGGLALAGEAHELMQNLLLALVFVHVAGSLYQRFVLGSDVLSRMVRVRAD
jgi:cytochrome b561